jgi:hypothetical protein
MDYVNLFAPVQTGIFSAITGVAVAALAIFTAVVGFRLGARLIKSFAK